jgi:calcineurin-like phosphoesterase family protein
MAIWFTADTHFGHSNIIKYSGRPFGSSDEMDEKLIENINRVVKPNDTLYHLGDWSFRNAAGYRQRINCQEIILVLGNHDKERSVYPRLFQGVHPSYLEIKVEGRPITLCHYAMRVWNKSHHGAWHLYGHSHGSLPDDPNSLSFDVGVDCWDYTPINLRTVAERMATKTFVPIDHHGKRPHEQARLSSRPPHRY